MNRQRVNKIAVALRLGRADAALDAAVVMLEQALHVADLIGAEDAGFLRYARDGVRGVARRATVQAETLRKRASR